MANDGHFMDAKYNGRCEGCGGRIESGDRIFIERTPEHVRSASRPNPWHAECAETEFDVEDKAASGRR